MASSTDSSFWKEHARAARPGNSASTNSNTRWGGQDPTSAGSCRLAAKKHLLQRVAAQPQPQRLEGDDLVGWDVSEVDLRAEVPDEPGLALLARGLPDQSFEGNGVLDL